MIRIRPMETLPRGLARIVEETAAGVAGLFGAQAAEVYRESAERRLGLMAGRPSVLTVAALDGPATAGLLMAMTQGAAARVTLLHVLDGYTGRGIEARLVRKAVSILRAGGVDGIVHECIAFCPLELGAVFRALGFVEHTRSVMLAPLDAPALASPGAGLSIAACREDWPEIAGLIVEAYRDHPDRDLHPDVRDAAGALDLLESASRGGFGACHPEYIRLVADGGCVVGAIIGAETAPGVGFVVQVVVRPGFQGRGLGGAMMRELAACFRARGLERMGLGVTLANPAVRLYRRLGFGSVRDVGAYAWWRP